MITNSTIDTTEVYKKKVTDYPAWIYPNKHSQTRHLKTYPSLTIDDLLDECEDFYDCLMRNGPLKVSGANYFKYFRGWLSRANYQREKNDI